MWPEEGSSPDANKYLGLLVFFLIVIPSWCILAVFLYRRNLQPIKGRLPMLSFLAQLCVLAHETYLCFKLMYGYEIPCGLIILIPFITVLPAADFYLARGYILYFVFHVTQERLALACDALAHERERAVSQSQSQSLLPTSEKDSTCEATPRKDLSTATVTVTATSRESTLKWFLRNRYRIERPFLSACLVTVNFLQMIYPVISAVIAGDSARLSRDQQENSACGSGYGDLVVGIEVAILIVVGIWIAIKLRNIHDAFFLKDELRLVSTISLVGVVIWIILSNIPAVQNYDRSVFGLTFVYVFFLEHTIFIITIVIPLYHSFDPIMQCNENEKNDADVEKLKQIIDIVPGFESFRAFVTREFSVQNLLFYVDVRDFRAKFDPNFVDANTRTKSQPTPPIAVVTATTTAITSASPTAATAPPSPSLAPSSPHSTSRDDGSGAQRATSLIATATATSTATIARPSSGAGAGAGVSSHARSSSTICTTASAILSTFPFGKHHKEKEKENDEYAQQQLAEHNKRILLTEANIQFEALRLFRKYIAFGAPLQVNLPDTIVTSLAQALGLNRDGSRYRARKKTERGGDFPTASFLSTHTIPSKHNSVSTAPMPRQDDIELNRIDIIMELNPIHYDMFNEAQQVILRLMAVDSFKRYKKSSDYEDLSRLIESDPLMKMGLGRL